ncbi:MAG: DUF975 family protein [bacterium]|nr:DUF975 family protein [bacterium]
MLPSNSVAKITAKTALKNKWLQAITVCLILIVVFLIQIFFEQMIRIFVLESGKFLDGVDSYAGGLWNGILNLFLTVSSLALTFLLVFPLVLGVVRWFWRMTGEAKDTVGVVFYYFGTGERFKRSVAVFFGLLWRNLVVGLLSFIPFFMAVILTNFAAEYDINQIMLFSVDFGNVINTIFLILGCVVYLILTLRYYMVLWVTVACPRLSVKQVFKTSVGFAKGTKAAYFVFILSFTGWAFISFLALPLLFTLPYFIAANAVFSRFVITNANLKASKV